MSDSDDDRVQRSLGRIEGMQGQILTELKAMRDDLGAHKNEDQRNFSAVRQLVYTKFDEQSVERNTHLAAQDEKLDGLKRDADRAKGAGVVIISILSILGTLATFVGTAVIAAITGHLKLF